MDFNTNHRIAYLEVLQILETERLVCIDHFADANAPFEIQAPLLAPFACRFDCFIAFLYPIDNYWMATGRIIQIEPIPTIQPLELLEPLCQHLGFIPSEHNLATWLESNFDLAAEAVEQLRLERQSLKILNADTRFSKTDYRLNTSTEDVTATIESLPQASTISLTDEDWQEGFQHVSQWRDDLDFTDSFPLGLVMVGPQSLRLESLGEESHSRFKKSFEAQLADRVSFQTEIGTDLGAQIAAREPERETHLIPQDLVSHIESILGEISKVESVAQRESVQAFPSAPHPLLHDQTPLQAVQDPNLRPIAIELVKQRIRETDLENLRKDRAYDTSALIDTLDLHEIDFPPPKRVKQSSFPEYTEPKDDIIPLDSHRELSEQQEEDLAYYDEAHERGLDLARLRAWEDSLFETRAKALILHRIMGPSQGACYSLIDSLYQVTPDLIKEDEFHICVPSIVTIWLALVPAGQQPVPSKEELERELNDMVRLFERTEISDAESTFDLIIPHSKQKELLYAVLDHFERMLNDMPEDELPENAGEGAMYAVIAAAINVLDRYM